MTDRGDNRSWETILAERVVHVDVAWDAAGKVRPVSATAPGITSLEPALPRDFKRAAEEAVGGRQVRLYYLSHETGVQMDAPEPMGRAA